MKRNINLQGRVEHTDSTQHAGTWHYQVHGKKIWYIRPLNDEDEWLNNIPILEEDCNNNNDKRKRTKLYDIGGKVQKCKDNILRLKIECNEGDILLINTRLWWHQTEIPSTESQQQKLSCSYARDFMTIYNNNDNNNEMKNEDNYTNIEGIYASKKLKKGDIVLTEDELPDCELHRSDSPNCEVTEINGLGVLRAIKVINAGEFLTVADSSDDDDNDDDDEEEEV